MIERAKSLVVEYTDRAPSATAEIPAFQHSISFQELRILAQTGKEAIEGALPARPQLTKDWYVPEEKDLGSPTEVLTDLTRKRTVLIHALHLLGATATAPVPGRAGGGRRTPLDYFRLIPRTIAWIGGVGGGVAIIVVAVHWTLGLF